MNASPKASEIKKYLMWSKINELKREGLSISKIKMLTGHDRKTIRKYLGMSESEFRERHCCVRQYVSRLDKYRGFILDRLRTYPFLSSGAIHANLRMSFPDLEKFNQKTVYNYVMKLREEEKIPKDKEGNGRPYCMLEQTAPGEYAQADFGEKWVDTEDGINKKKLYFFTMVLSRWRHKFVYFSDKPFTAEMAAYAHELTFEYFGGVPRYIVYDQDKVLLHNENLGDYILTQSFKKLIAECGFTPIFCRKSDPESKGKVENVVKYVKNSLLAGYVFKGMEKLHSDTLKWLETTANGIQHATTGLIPSVMYNEEEKANMMPYNGVPTPPGQELPTYVLRKNNTISYKGNFYAVPPGSYKGRGSFVRVLEKETEVEIYSVESGKLLMRHPLCKGKGQLVTNTGCRRNPDLRIEPLQQTILDFFGESETVSRYLMEVRKAFPRNVRDNLMAIEKNLSLIDKSALMKAMELHLDVCKVGVNAMLQTARNIEKKGTGQTAPIQTANIVPTGISISLPDMMPQKTSMTSYSIYF